MFQSSSKLSSGRLAAGVLALSLLCSGANAITIVATPQETGGGFLHNVFHSANAAGGASGTIWAWMDLNTSVGPLNDWNPGTGVLTIYVNLYSDVGLTTLVGTAIGNSSNLFGANFSAPNAQDGGLLGNVDWSFDLAAITFLQSLDPLITNPVNQAFVDRNYVTSGNGSQANSLQGGKVTLWGADSASLLNTNTSGDNFDVNTTILGTDLVFTTAVPVPAPLLLFGSALGALGVLRRKLAG